jgi:pimeloyl-ACP methyl ester carboxylesterase
MGTHQQDDHMTAAFVHGNPETAAIWDELFEHLDRKDLVTLSPPGFGAPVPAGFAATSDAYLAWLVDAVAALEAPVDLVGHDWGGGHVMRLAMTRPDLIRSWTSDIAGCMDPDYVWHDMAQLWQTPGGGEQAVEAMVGAPLDQRVAQFESLGMAPAVARRVASANDATMGRCILSLYRSAAQPAMANWGKDLANAKARPGLVIIPTEDHYTGGETLARRSAQRAGAQVAVLDGLGHWWMCENPAPGAQVLNAFFAELR